MNTEDAIHQFGHQHCRLRTLLLLLIMGLLPLALVLAGTLSTKVQEVHAAALGTTITVTTFTDELNSDGDCSLREAVQAANTSVLTFTLTVTDAAGLYDSDEMVVTVRKSKHEIYLPLVARE